MRRSFRVLISLSVASFQFATGVEAQTRSQMPPLHGEALTFDPVRGRIVLFGGSAFPGDWIRETWEWDDKGWQMVADSSASPEVRAGHVMGFDPEGKRVFLFGGMFGPPLKLRCDTWIRANAKWTRAAGEPCITDRVRNASMAYANREKTMLLVDGPAVANDTTRPLKLWRWNNSNWTLVDSTGPRRTGFSAVAYDEARGVLVVPVLFGGPDAGVWEWSGSRWAHVADTTPGTRQTYSLVYDPQRRQVLMLGGQGGMRGPYFDDAWTWNGAHWTRITAEDPRPGGRAGASLLFDTTNQRLLYFGGYDTMPLPELWVRDARGWRKQPAH